MCGCVSCIRAQLSRSSPCHVCVIKPQGSRLRHVAGQRLKLAGRTSGAEGLCELVQLMAVCVRPKLTARRDSLSASIDVMSFMMYCSKVNVLSPCVALSQAAQACTLLMAKFLNSELKSTLQVVRPFRSRRA